MKNQLAVVLLGLCMSCNSSTSNKELELLQRENELLKKENELAKKEKEVMSLSTNSSDNNDVNDYSINAPEVDLNNPEFIQHLKEALLGQKMTKGFRTWTFVSLDEFTEFRVLNAIKEGGSEYVEVSTVLTDVLKNGKRFYGHFTIIGENGKVRDINVKEFRRL